MGTLATSPLRSFSLFLVATALSAAPFIPANGIINAVQDVDIAPASPGCLISIYGTELANATLVAPLNAQGSLPTVLGGTRIRIGGQEVPLLFVSPGQVNAQVPYNLAPGVYNVVAETSGGTSAPVSLTLTAVAPGVFPGAVVRNADQSVVSAANPTAGGDVLVTYANGLGAVKPPVPSGQIAPAAVLSFTDTQPRVRINGQRATVYNSVLSPGFVGLYQIGHTVPAGLRAGAYPLRIEAGGRLSNAFSLRVRPASVPSGPTLSFQPLQELDLGTADVDQLRSADVDGDGNLDFFLGFDARNETWLFFGKEDGTVSDKLVVPLGLRPRHIRAADVNGDGLMDLIAIDNRTTISQPISVAAGLGDRKFAEPVQFNSPDRIFMLEVADVDGDGLSDLLTGGDQSFIVQYNTTKVDLNAAVPAPPTFSPDLIRTAARVIGAGDLNGDGRADVVLRDSNERTASVWINKGGRQFEKGQTVDALRTIQSIDVLDFDGQNGPDIVFGTDGDFGYFAAAAGGGGYGRVASNLYTALPTGTQAADINGDGRLDLVQPHQTYTLIVLQQAGGAFSAAQQIAAFTNRQSGKLVVSDVNRDGRQDLILIQENRLRVLTQK